MTSAISQFALVRHAADGVDPAVAQILLSLGGGFGIAWLPLAVLVAAIAAEGMRGTIVARGIAWVGAGLAAGLAVGYVPTESGLVAPAGYLAIMLIWPWFVAASVSFIRRAGADAPDHPVTRSPGVSLR
jgi:hypothetical protein